MFTARDLPEGWTYKPKPVQSARWDFLDKENEPYLRWCIVYESRNGAHQLEYYNQQGQWVIHTPYSEMLTHEEAVHLVVTLIRLGEAERLANEFRT